MYVDAILSDDKSTVNVVERFNGKRVYKDYKADYHFFLSDPKGTHRNIFNDPVKKIVPSSFEDRAKLSKMYNKSKTWEIDMKPTIRCLEQNYLGVTAPKLHTAFFDIETKYDPVFGYSTPEEALNEICSVAVYLDWLKQDICLAVPPNTLSWEEAEGIASQIPNVLLCRDEAELLTHFLMLIEDADVLSGWNSEFFDLPVIVHRIIKVLDKKQTIKLCLWNKFPKKRKIDRGGKVEITYDLVGRVHLDYMQLYKKYTFEQKQSYSLDNIAFEELGENKVSYDGTLDQLYRKDFKLFLEYNIHDTKLLDKLNQSLQYIDLANSIAHDVCVPITAVSGAVVTTEQAIVIEAHSRGLIVPNKQSDNDRDYYGDEVEEERAAGGWVSNPKVGIHKWVGASDLNSLYPSVIRSLNMCNETIVAQVLHPLTDKSIDDFVKSGSYKDTFSAWWNDRFSTLEMDHFFNNDNATKLKVRFETGEEIVTTGAELRKLVFAPGSNLCISANGTIFKTNVKGVIPGLLERWYNERKYTQGIKKSYDDLLTEDPNKFIRIPENLYNNEFNDTEKANQYTIDGAFKSGDIKSLISSNNKEGLQQYLNARDLHVVDGVLRPKNISEAKTISDFWDKRQLVKKILLNSLYGGLLNEAHRFYDKRLGQSTTLTGRCITRHMSAKTNEILAGVYDHRGITCIYNDTDSCYFSAYPALKDSIDAGKIDWTKDTVIKLYDEVSDAVSDTFPDFMLETFNVPKEQGVVIKSSREIVAESALFIKKKRYAAMVIDKEGKRQDLNGKPGKVKVTGLDLRRSDTPKFVQAFLMDILTSVLVGSTEDQVITKIREFRKVFNEMQPWQKGSPKSVNNLTKYRDKEEAALESRCTGKKSESFTVPSHVRGALNWNLLIDINNDRTSTKILDGSKIIFCYLKETSDTRHMKTICYPVDEPHLPDWFVNLPFDNKTMESKMIDNKIENLLGVLNWDLSRSTNDSVLFENLFDW